MHRSALGLRRLVARSLRPSYGARANAADALQEVREERAQAAEALAAAGTSGPHHGTRRPEASR